MKQRARALIGFMSEPEAIQLLAGTGSPEKTNLDRWRREWVVATKAASNRSHYETTDPRVAIPPHAERRLNEIAQRDDVKALLGPLEWSLGWADLSKAVLSYQRVVIVDGALDRVRGIEGSNVDDLIEVCLPDPDVGQFQGNYDQAQSAFTASSLNPNLRVAGFQVASVQVSPAGPAEQLFGFKLTHGSSFVQLVHYKGRWLVRDGYHRIYGLLSKGITSMPCVIIQARTFEETGAGRAGFFGYETLYGGHPPYVTDFFSDASADIQVPAVMRVIRLRAEEFVVPVINPEDLRRK